MSHACALFVGPVQAKYDELRKADKAAEKAADKADKADKGDKVDKQAGSQSAKVQHLLPCTSLSFKYSASLSVYSTSLFVYLSQLSL